jgi:hypothetical protein
MMLVIACAMRKVSCRMLAATCVFLSIIELYK